jgi:hypothetical protein
MSKRKTHKSQSLTAAMLSLHKVHRQYFQALPLSHLLRYRTAHFDTLTAATLAVCGTEQHYTVIMVHAAVILPVDPGSLTS